MEQIRDNKKSVKNKHQSEEYSEGDRNPPINIVVKIKIANSATDR